MSENKRQVIHAVEVLQHSCFIYEDDDVVVTVYSKTKEEMMKSEVNWYLDAAKANLLEKK